MNPVANPLATPAARRIHGAPPAPSHAGPRIPGVTPPARRNPVASGPSVAPDTSPASSPSPCDPRSGPGTPHGIPGTTRAATPRGHPGREPVTGTPTVNPSTRGPHGLAADRRGAGAPHLATGGCAALAGSAPCGSWVWSWSWSSRWAW